MTTIDKDALAQQIAHLEHAKEAGDFLLSHPRADLPVADQFRDTLYQEVKAGNLSAAEAGTALEGEIIEEVFETQAQDAN
jgi:hypothetical protein